MAGLVNTRLKCRLCWWTTVVPFYLASYTIKLKGRACPSNVFLLWYLVSAQRLGRYWNGSNSIPHIRPCRLRPIPTQQRASGTDQRCSLPTDMNVCHHMQAHRVPIQPRHTAKPHTLGISFFILLDLELHPPFLNFPLELTSSEMLKPLPSYSCPC